jgi:hypothetical protein
MPIECSKDLLGFARVEGRSVVAGFDGGKVTSDAGGRGCRGFRARRGGSTAQIARHGHPVWPSFGPA